MERYERTCQELQEELATLSPQGKLIGLHRLGKWHLSLEPYPADRSLGLRPLGALAFTGFWRRSSPR